MDAITELLFSPLPRYVANPSQWLVYDEPSFDMFKEANEGSANCYSRISWVEPDGEWWLDRVLLDLDSEMDIEMTDAEMITELRANQQFAEELLGSVVDDARAIARLLAAESIPAVGVYTGKGIHIHILYERRKNPQVELQSQTDWIIDQADVQTADRQVTGDVKRLCRVPNCRRYDERLERPLDLWTVPVERRELRDITAQELVAYSESPRQIELPADSRPPYLTHPDYQPDENAAQTVRAEAVDMPAPALPDGNEEVQEWVQDIVRIPCLQELVVSANPPHKIRMALAIELLNVGLTVDEIVQTCSQLGWADWDPKVTRKQVKQIRDTGYDSFSCAQIQADGHCLWSYEERAEECDDYGYPGGIQTY